MDLKNGFQIGIELKDTHELLKEWASKYLPSSFLPLLTSPNINEIVFIDPKNGNKFKVFLNGWLHKIAVEIENKQTGIKYDLTMTDEDETAIRIFNLRNRESGVEVNFLEPNHNLDVASMIAALGAATSRQDMTIVEIAESYVSKNTSNILNKIYNEYKHDSPAGMAYEAIAIDNISIANCFALFYYLNVGDGQELSTRYVKFVLKEILLNPALIESLGEEYREEILGLMQDIQDFEVQNYKEWILRLEGAYRKFFEDAKAKAVEEGNEEVKSLKVKKPIENRSLDIARQFVPLGSLTKFYLVASARVWRQLIKRLRESEDISQRKLAEDIALMFKIKAQPEVEDLEPQMVHPDLIKHSEATKVVESSTQNLKEFLETLPGFNKLLETRTHNEREGTRTNVELMELGEDAVAFMYIIGLYPDLDPFKLWMYLKTELEDYDKGLIGELIYSQHFRHEEMTNKADVRSYQVFIVESAIAYLRDFNRHRATGRMMTLFENGDIDEILKDGFNKNTQIHELSFLKQFSEAWDESMSELYRRIRNLNETLKLKGVSKELRREIIINHLPLGHQAKLYMSIPDGNIPYLMDTRGATEETADRDSGYVEITKYLLDALNEQNPYFRLLFKKEKKIDPENPVHVAKRG